MALFSKRRSLILAGEDDFCEKGLFFERLSVCTYWL